MFCLFNKTNSQQFWNWLLKYKLLLTNVCQELQVHSKEGLKKLNIINSWQITQGVKSRRYAGWSNLYPIIKKLNLQLSRRSNDVFFYFKVLFLFCSTSQKGENMFMVIYFYTDQFFSLRKNWTRQATLLTWFLDKVKLIKKLKKTKYCY